MLGLSKSVIQAFSFLLSKKLKNGNTLSSTINLNFMVVIKVGSIDGINLRSFHMLVALDRRIFRCQTFSMRHFQSA